MTITSIDQMAPPCGGAKMQIPLHSPMFPPLVPQRGEVGHTIDRVGVKPGPWTMD